MKLHQNQFNPYIKKGNDESVENIEFTEKLDNIYGKEKVKQFMLIDGFSDEGDERYELDDHGDKDYTIDDEIKDFGSEVVLSDDDLPF